MRTVVRSFGAATTALLQATAAHACTQRAYCTPRSCVHQRLPLAMLATLAARSRRRPPAPANRPADSLCAQPVRCEP